MPTHPSSHSPKILCTLIQGHKNITICPSPVTYTAALPAERIRLGTIFPANLEFTLPHLVDSTPAEDAGNNFCVALLVFCKRCLPLIPHQALMMAPRPENSAIYPLNIKKTQKNSAPFPTYIHFYSHIPRHLCSFLHLEVSKMTMDKNKNNGRYEIHNSILLKLK